MRTRAQASEQDDTGSLNGDGLYELSPRGQRSQQRQTQLTESQSQMSMASSQPASQLMQSQQDTSQSQPYSSAASSSEPIQPARLATFRQTLGPLMGEVFSNEDTADLEMLIGAVNRSIRSTPSLGEEHVFQRTEAIKALRVMNERNELM